MQLPHTGVFNEPRIAIDAQDRRWVIASDAHNYDAVVFRSADGGKSYTRFSDPPRQNATPDVDIVITRTGRIIASELDGGATGFDIRFVTSYSDDEGKTWTRSTGMVPADTDRQWLAVGPDDPVTHQPRVYLLFHNLFTGEVVHGMFVQTSTDNGATFGTPVPVMSPTDQAFLDLQCADSGGPSSLSVNPTNGRLYAVFGTRSSPVAGGCGATVTDGAEANIVRATRVWVSTSPDNSLGSWKTSLAVDDSNAHKVVGMQLSYGTLDRAGNVYVAYPEGGGDGDLTASVKLVHAPPDLSSWSKPATVAQTGAGHVLVHAIAGDPGRIDLAYYSAVAQPTGDPVWYSTFAQSIDALSASPHFSEVRLGAQPAYRGTAKILLGECVDTPVVGGVISGYGCGRFSDVYGLAADHEGRAIVAWPGQSGAPAGVLSGVYVSTQVGGPTLFAPTASPAPRVAVKPKQMIPATGGPTTGAIAIAGLGLIVALGVIRRRLLRRA